MAKAKSIKYRGQRKSSDSLTAATEFIHQFALALGDGRTEFDLEYDKTESGSTLTVRTVRAKVEEPKNDEAKPDEPGATELLPGR